MKLDVPRCDPERLQPFPDLVDHCCLYDWQVGLGVDRAGWHLTVREGGSGGELLAKASSALAPARAIPDMALRVSMGLDKQRKKG